MGFKLPENKPICPDDPEALFRDLRKRTIPGLLSHQADLLRSYIKVHTQHADIALQLPTGSGKTLVGLLIAEWRRRKYGESEKLLTKALELEPDNPEANYALGMLYARQDNFEDALKYLKKAMAIRPDYPDALNNLGVLFIRAQRYSEAEEQFKTCIRIAPNFDQAYLNLARLYVVLKNEDKAKEILNELLKLQPQHKMAQQALEMLN